MNIETNIGTNIKNRRIELGMTQEELAEKMGYKTKSSINKIENGTNDIPQSKVVKFAEVLHTTIPYLMGWDQQSIDAESEQIADANAYDDNTEHALHDFMVEIAENGFSSNDINNIRRYAIAIKKTETDSNEQLHKAFIDLFMKLYELDLNIDDLNEVYTYAQFIKSRKH